MVENSNPYEPPATETFPPPAAAAPPVAGSTTDRKLYSPGAVLLATFFGSFLGGAAVLAINFHRLQRRRAVWTALVLGGLGSLILATIGIALPDNARMLNLVLLLVQLGVMKQVTSSTQGRELLLHGQEGRFASNWGAAGLGLAAAAALLIVVVGATVGVHTFRLKSKLGSKVEVSSGKGTVYYGEGASEEDARKVGRSLAQPNAMGDSQRFDARVTRDGEGLVISVVIADGAWDEAGVVEAFRSWGESLKTEEVRRPFRIHLCDSELEPHRTLIIR